MSDKRKAPDRDALLAVREEIVRSGEVMLRARRAELDEREKELQEKFEHKVQRQAKKFKAREEKLVFEREKYSRNTSPSDVLRLNIGGTKKVSILRSTLTCVPNSTLAAKFSGRWDDSLAKDKDGDFLIDHDHSEFDPILTFLRNKVIADTEGKPTRPPSLVGYKLDKIENFHQLVDYYGLKEAMYSSHTPFAKLSLRDAEQRFDGAISGLKGSTSRWGDFGLTSPQTKSNIQTIEVKFKARPRSFGIVWWEDLKPFGSKAIGLVIDNSAHFELEHSKIDSDEVIALLDSSENIIRSEDYGRRWYVNGTRLKTSFAIDELEYFDESVLVPFIRVVVSDFDDRGEFEVTDIELGQ